MVITLNKKQFDYLNDSLLEKQELIKMRLQVIEESRHTLIEIDEDTADEIRDWANEELQRKGFDINYALTKEGEMLESLIDIFHIE